eukprot:6179493-Pleurochrysis_carterae.AAC.4
MRRGAEGDGTKSGLGKDGKGDRYRYPAEIASAEGGANVALRCADVKEGRFEGLLSSFALPMRVERHRDYLDIPFKEGESAKTLEPLESLGLVVDVSSECASVWTCNAKAPSTAVHPLTQVRLATRNNSQIRQKTSPIPLKHVKKAAKAEVNGVLTAD